ncbi:MAG: hypothetical protein BWZ07_02121 [Alphaproteobacteria bacterium ADurb.BinA280]|nr:MAG: hypothetical protein BWZ07_02121 [Alphaproteobacteria bacterium ADurb.BinA280]
MCQHGGDLVFAHRSQEQARIHAHIAAERREGVDVARFQEEERIGLFGAFALTRNSLAHALQIICEQRVVQQFTAIADLSQHRFAIQRFIAGGDNRFRRRADIRQVRLCRCRLP